MTAGFGLLSFSFDTGDIMKIEAVIFDCDGLMFDTEIVAQQIWRDEARKYGITYPEDFFQNITGAGGRDNARYIASIPGLGEILPRIRAKRFDLSFWRSIQTDCLNRRGLIELFTWLEENDYKVAICSSSERAYVEALIATCSKPLKYDVIVCGDMVSHAKPDPEIFLRGAEELGVRPENCLVLEDSKQGILAAKAAGMHSCFIPDTIVPDEVMKAALDMQRDSLLDVIDLLAENRSEQ